MVDIDHFKISDKLLESCILFYNIDSNYINYHTSISKLANGEYNENYILNIEFVYDDKKSSYNFVIRINHGSQLKLDRQIAYEYESLKYLENSGVTPKPIFLDETKNIVDRDYLVMEYIDGTWLDYNLDIEPALSSLARLHTYSNFSYKTKGIDFIHAYYPQKLIIDECKSMYSIYKKSRFYNSDLGSMVEDMFEIAESSMNISVNNSDFVFINTELNSSNFLISGKNKCCIVDWEKPIFGEKEQDIGHFLAPTTTFWKTDRLYNKDEVDSILDRYIEYFNKYSNNLRYIDEKDIPEFKNKVCNYIKLNCLRGLTWSLMAWVEYNDGSKIIINDFTYNKLKQYTDKSFINYIRLNYFL